MPENQVWAMDRHDIMREHTAIVVLGTFDSKPEEHLFLKKCIENRGLRAGDHKGTKTTRLLIIILPFSFNAFFLLFSLCLCVLVAE